MQPVVTSVAILGATTLGVDLALTFAARECRVLLFDVASPVSLKYASVSEEVLELMKKNFPKIGEKQQCIDFIHPCNYRDHLPLLKDVEVIFETHHEIDRWKKRLWDSLLAFTHARQFIFIHASGPHLIAYLEDIAVIRDLNVFIIHLYERKSLLHLVDFLPLTKNLHPQAIHILQDIIGLTVLRCQKSLLSFHHLLLVLHLISLFHAHRLKIPYDFLEILAK